MNIKIIQSETDGIYEKDGNSLYYELEKCKTIDCAINVFNKHSVTIIDENGKQYSYIPTWVLYEFINLKSKRGI